jgi:hypothetical protein
LRRWRWHRAPKRPLLRANPPVILEISVKIIRKTEKENEMGPNTLSIMMGAGGLIAALVAYLLYSSFKRA